MDKKPDDIIQNLNDYAEDEKSEIARLQAEIGELRAQLSFLQWQYNEVTNAFFWKITKPFRCILNVLNRNKWVALFNKGLHSLKSYGLKATWAKIKTHQNTTRVIDEAQANLAVYFPDDKKRVFVLSHELSLTGAPLVLVQAVRILRQNGWQVVVASPEDGAVAQDFARLGVPVLILGDLDRNGRWMQMAATFDLVLVNTIVPYRQIQLLGDMEVPVLWWLHDARIGYEETLQYVLPETVGRNIHIYAVSRYAEKVVTEYRPKYSADLLPYGLEDEAAKYESCENPFADDPRAVFLSVGTITPRKGQDILAEAICRLPYASRKQCRFLFIGKAVDQSIYRNLLRLKKRFPEEVELLGEMPHDKLPPYFAHAAGVICSSRDDPLPTFMTETMMMSGVCICSEHTGTAALIEPGKNGFLYRNNDPDELAECIRQVLVCGDTKSLRQEARKTYENVFSEEIFEKNILRSVADCMGETKKARGDKKWIICP